MKVAGFHRTSVIHISQAIEIALSQTHRSPKAMETATDSLAWRAYLDFGASLLLVFVLLCITTVVLRSNARLSKLGARAPPAPSPFPLGR
jgi:hypothetical protein